MGDALGDDELIKEDLSITESCEKPNATRGSATTEVRIAGLLYQKTII